MQCKECTIRQPKTYIVFARVLFLLVTGYYDVNDFRPCAGSLPRHDEYILLAVNLATKLHVLPLLYFSAYMTCIYIPCHPGSASSFMTSIRYGAL